MTLTIEDAILRLKAEIIAQDWRLSPKRTEQLETAFACLRQHFADHKPIHAMLIMATNVLAYIKNRGASPPETIDFLKEAMAHVVNLHEDLSVDPGREEKLFQGLFTRFTTLKTKIQHKGGGLHSATTTKPPAQPVRQQELETYDEDASPASEQDLITLLCEEFNNSLVKTGPIGKKIAPLFASWLDSSAVYSLLHCHPPQAPSVDERNPSRKPLDAITPCPPTPVKVLTFDGSLVMVQKNAIAMIRAVSPSMAALYLQNATIPLKDFSKFLQKLAHQFSGSLAQVDERTLMTLSLPIMIPQGNDLPEMPTPSSNTLVLLSSGNRHGAILCEAVQEYEQTMFQFAKQQNGDIAGTAYTEDGRTFPLLDPFTMLQREGILLIQD